MMTLLERAYHELLVAQYERIEDNDGAVPACTCCPGDPLPACRTHAVLVEIYDTMAPATT